MALLNILCSYIVLVIVFIAVAGVAVALGIYLRKRKDAKTPESVQADQNA